jgi:hypothetical protein
LAGAGFATGAHGFAFPLCVRVNDLIQMVFNWSQNVQEDFIGAIDGSDAAA